MPKSYAFYLLALSLILAAWSDSLPPLTEGQVRADIAAISDKFKVEHIEIAQDPNRSRAYAVTVAFAKQKDQLALLYEFDDNTKNWKSPNIKEELQKSAQKQFWNTDHKFEFKF